MARRSVYRPNVWLVLLIAGTGCGDDTDSGRDVSADTSVTPDLAGPRPDTPTPWIFEDDVGTIEPALGADELEAALTAALDAALDVDPELVKNLHDSLFPPPVSGSGDLNGCPFVLTYDYGNAKAFYWQGECTAADGRMYSGYGYASWYDDYPAEFGTLDGYEYSLAGRITGPDGTWLEATGTATAYEGGGPDVDGFARALDGTFRAGGPGAPHSPWLDGTRRPSLEVSGWIYKPTGGKNLTFDGGIGGLEAFPGGVTAVALDGLTLRTTSAGAACQKEPGGSASVRAPDGSWYDVVFDGPTDDEPDTTPEELCDGCGETFFRGDDVFPTCLPTNGLLSWEDRPW